jgi:16S rRNA G966 N2-methylase RsmD
MIDTNKTDTNKTIEIRTEGLHLKPINEFVELQGNLKIMDEKRLNRLTENIIANGFIAPVFIWQNNIVDGHQRLKALAKLLQDGYTMSYKGKNVGNKVPFIMINAKDRQEAAKFILTYNSQYGQMVGLDEFLNDFKLNWADIDSQLMLTNDNDYHKFGKATNKLKDDWIMPPFSILDTRQAYWHDRRNEWYTLMGDTAFTRENALGNDLLGTINSGVSLFDPVLAEIIYKWFCPAKNSKILNLFAGDVEPNIVAAYRGYKLTGIELRQEQIEHTMRIATQIKCESELNLVCDDVLNIDKHTQDNEFDIIISSPPFYDLEEYSTDERDFANKEETDFDALLQQVINSSVKKLKDNRFAVFVVSEVRRPDGSYRGLVPKVINWFEQAGLKYYNEIILINAIGTLPFRINKAWQNRKIGRMHQNVLVFFKGKVKQIEKEFDKVRQNGQLHQKVLVFFKGEMENIKKEFEQQDAEDLGKLDNQIRLED